MDYLNRKLGLIENLFKILHDLGAMIDVNVARIEGPLTPEILQPALDLVQKRHPMLQVHIVELADGFYFRSEGTSKIPLRVIDKQHENQGIEIAEDELHQKFSEGLAPLCRVTFLRSSTSNGISEIIATFHHAITDGMSCMRFFDDLLSYCQKIAAGDYIGEVVTMQPLPPLEKLLESRLTKHNLEAAQDKPSQEIQPPQLIIEREAPPSARRTHLLTRILSPEMARRLKESCKQEETTVHGALCAAMLFGTANIASIDTSIPLSCSSNVNLRKYCEPEVKDDYIGCLISGLEEIHTWKPSTTFWDLARECKAKITHSIRRELPISGINSDKIRQVNKDLLVYLSEQKMGRTNTISISNRGRFNLVDKYGDFTLKELYFATGQHIVGACFWLGVVTFHEQLFCTFGYVVPLVSDKTAELFADSVMDTMQKACISASLTFQ
jgi:NRPS condensation-like uncharacterized protein